MEDAAKKEEEDAETPRVQGLAKPYYLRGAYLELEGPVIWFF